MERDNNFFSLAPSPQGSLMAAMGKVFSSPLFCAGTSSHYFR
jgi:hypothetical protein